MEDSQAHKFDKLYKNYIDSNWSMQAAREYLSEAEKAGDITYTKALDSFQKRDERDLFVHVALHRAGIKFTALPEDAPEGCSNIDSEIKGKLWEIKCPNKQVPDVNLNFVRRNMAKAKMQFRNCEAGESAGMRLIFCSHFTTASTDDAIRRELMNCNLACDFCEMKFVDTNGNVETLK